MTGRTATRASLLFAVAGLATSLGAIGAPADATDWTFSGDLRAGYFASERTARDGAESDQDSFNARLRLVLERRLDERWTVRTRVAGRFSSEQDDTAVYLRGYAPTRTGTAFGDITLDEAYLGYQAPDDGLRLRVGRFQTAFSVPGVASKGLDRNDSPGVGVNWTDGVHLDLPVAGGWRGHVIGQYRNPKGSGGVAYAPLDFSDGNSRATVFVGLENKHRLGPITQRMLSLTWMPHSLADRGLADPAREDYITVDARVAAEWPLGAGGPRLVTGAEVGYATQTPRDAVAGTGGTGDTGGLAWQVQASVYDFAPNHHIGVAVGSADAGWLISPDYRPNDRSAEIRYQWQFLPKTSMEARVRERRELEHPKGTRARVDHDLYVRLTHKF
ncbi:MAG: putative porin [Pseudomonadales bacterium]|nr:putative porin [Pseudomonadales bacterium]